MRTLLKRVSELEATTSASDWNEVFDRLSDDDLDQLVRILTGVAIQGAITPEEIAALSDDDAALLVRVMGMKAEPSCVS